MVKKIDIFTVYLDDLSEDVRIKQTKILLRHISKNKPTIVMGDLNTLNHGDITKTNLLLKKFTSDNRQLFKDMLPVLNEMKRGDVTKIFKEYGLQDADKNGEPTAPSKLSSAKLDSAILRIDYAFHTNEIQIYNFKVFKDSVFDLASDHYPIIFDINIKNHDSRSKG